MTVERRTRTRRTAGVRRPVARGRGRSERQARRRFVQFIFCGFVFVTLVAVKLWTPHHAVALRQTISDAIEHNMDVQEVFSTVGRAFSGDGDAAQGLREVWRTVFQAEEIAVPDDGASVETMTPYEWAGSFGNSTAFASLSEPWPDTPVTPSTPEAPSDATAVDDAAPGQASVRYSGRNLPDNVGMEQVLLNFDYCRPANGVLTSGFGYRTHPVDGAERFHYGADLSADTGTDVVAFADGVVTAVGESTTFGKYCTVEHSGGFTTLYAHCNRVTAAAGASVRMGDKIAEVGATGQATGPHLHFALQREGVYLNPVYYLTD